ncbi:FAR1 DNA binding domain [Macleaya cordata]|uniref:Protein FAR1-RELATED SEQUENCE n=1 Tax=Macleaya cordata TaxID=56857 RepID=A0A200PS37_MACCD|nr:FAR1 DNA binding domain [Macleaya cordata]
MEFESEEAARIFYNSYARRTGFSTRVSVYHRSRRDGAIICRQIVCSRQGFRHERDRDGNSSESRSKRQRAVTRVGCKAMIMVKKQDSGKWVVTKFVKEHNHELVPPDKVHSLRSHRHVSGPARSLIDTLQAAGIGPSGADYDTINTAPVLKTPSPMEKQAASLFTRRMFMKFQEELVETLAITATKTEDSGTITTYRVAKFGEDHKAYMVRFHVFEMKANCSCQMFEFAGVVLNERAIELPNNSRESLTVRFNNLRQEAIKFVEEGAKSLHTYNVAIEALQEAAKRVAAAKAPGTGVAQVGTLVNGSHRQLNASEGNQSGQPPSFTADEKDKRILELMSELDNVNQRCEVYRGNLLGVLKDMEEQKLKLSVKVQNVRLNLKD